jgi:membrane associated rhomboid family serine protease
MATCYRHPDRETGVACSNCGRPICPDCMTPTPVGMRCPECASQRTKVKTGTAAFGRAGTLPATYALIAINVVAFLAEIATGSGGLLSANGSVVDNFTTFGPAIADGEWYRIVTGGFLHYGLIHIGFNMYALYILGQLLEPAFGRARFLTLYFASLLSGSLGAVLISPDSHTAGASGAIFGLFTAAFIIARGRRLDAIATQLGFLLLINFAFTFGVKGISIGGHLFGAAAGLLCGLLILEGDKGRFGTKRIPAEIAAMALLGIAAAAAAIAFA